MDRPNKLPRGSERIEINYSSDGQPYAVGLVMVHRDDFGDLAESREIFRADAGKIEHMLFRLLPGGTYDHLLCRLMERKAAVIKWSRRHR